jgi:hypothetical protein
MICINQGEKMKFILIILAMMLFGCNTHANKSWVNRPPYNFSGEKIDYKILGKTIEEQYIIGLEEKNYLILDQEIYKKLTGEDLKKTYALALRAVYTNEGGEYKVIQNKRSDILVKYYVLGNNKQVNKSILLIEVNQLPNNIYVSYSMAR